MHVVSNLLHVHVVHVASFVACYKHCFCLDSTFVYYVWQQMLDIQGGPKKRGHSTFSQISRKLLKVSKMIFCTHQGKCMPNMSIMHGVIHFVAKSGATW